MIDYKALSDKELLSLYQNKKDQWAFDEISERYKDTVKFHARFFYLTGGEGEDLLQEGMIGLFDAVNTYNYDRNASFATFADKCIRSRIIKAVKFDNKKNNKPLNDSISLEGQREQAKENEGNANADRLESDSGEGDPETLVVDREMKRLAIECISKELSKLEEMVFKLYLAGKNMREIAETIGKPYKSVDNTFTRIKSKVKEMLRAGDGSLADFFEDYKDL